MADPLIITFIILLAAIGLLLSERLRPDLVALLVVVALGVTGVLVPRETFSGFSSSAVVTIVAIFILTEALRITGVTERVGDLLLRLAGAGERRLVVVLMLAGALLSLVMNNIAAAAVLLPAVSGIARRARISPARLLMPLAFATILGGMATLFTTTNIVVSGVLRSQNLAGFGVLDFAPLGLPIVTVGILYMALWGQRMLPDRPLTEDTRMRSARRDNLVEIYRLGERLFRARVPADSALIRAPLAASTLREQYGVNLVAVERQGQVTAAPPPNLVLAPGDVIWLEGKLEEFRTRDVAPYLEILPSSAWRVDDLESPTVALVEAILAPRSTLLGQTLRSARFREKYGMVVLGIWRAGRPIRTGLSELPLQFGDALLLQGRRAQLPLLQTEPDLIVLDRGREEDASAGVRRKGWLALIIMAGTLVIAAFNTALVGEIMLGGALLVVLMRVLTMDQAYGAVEWRSVFLVAGMLPLGLAMTNSGAAALLADGLVRFLGGAGPLAVLTGLFVLTILLTQTMHGAAVATIVAPIAIQTAQQASLNPRALAMAVALATSMAFLTPLGHPVNVLVMGPGGYQFRDYLRVGLPLTVLLVLVVLVGLPLVWPLTLP
ncbi:SLC13 family permease [Candidatus Amarolinea aalborgensis]|uniref:SLC13 family permease n=1 Tax=Candidatus Amarolinea aalborgensis TaxID=2249329 RepID=UPI003BFA3963